jgi:branched-chain amino acid transport system substrate-binding protein
MSKTPVMPAQAGIHEKQRCKTWMPAFAGMILFLSICFLPLATHADIRIAVVAPLSGPVAGTGDELKSGIEAAAKAINEQGGVLNQKIVLDFFDDACNPTQSTTVAGKVIATGPFAVIGPLCSGATLASAITYADYGVAQITFSSNTQITESGYKHLFRLMGRDDTQTISLAAYMSRSLARADKLAVLDDKNAWGRGFADKLVAALDAKGVKPTLRDSISQGQKDFTSLITKFRETDITVVALGMHAMEAGLLVRQAREQGFKGTFYGGDALQTADLWKIAGPAAEGLRFSGPYDPRNTERGKQLMLYLKENKKPYGVYTNYGYAAVETLAQALKRAGAKNGTDLLLALRDATFNTLAGEISFDQKGDLKKYTYQIYAWHEGDTVPLSFQPE